MNAFKETLRAAIDDEAGHAYAYGGGGILTIILLVILLIWLF